MFGPAEANLPSSHSPVSRQVRREGAERTQSPEFAATGDRGPANFDFEYTRDTGYASPAPIQVKVHFLSRALMVANEPQRYARVRSLARPLVRSRSPELTHGLSPFDLIGGFRVPASGRTGDVFDFPFSGREVRNSPRRSTARDNVVRIATSNESCGDVTPRRSTVAAA